MKNILIVLVISFVLTTTLTAMSVTENSNFYTEYKECVELLYNSFVDSMLNKYYNGNEKYLIRKNKEIATIYNDRFFYCPSKYSPVNYYEGDDSSLIRCLTDVLFMYKKSYFLEKEEEEIVISFLKKYWIIAGKTL